MKILFTYSTQWLLLLFLVTSLTSSTDSFQKADKWKKYKNKEYKFFAKFPEKPVVSEEISVEGNTLAVQHFDEISGEMYFVSVFNANENLSSSGLSTLAVQTFTQEMDGALLMTKDLPNGKEATISLEGNQFIIYQVKVVEDRMYQVITTTNHPQGCEKSTKYLDSFEILD